MAQTIELKEDCGGCGATGNQPLHPEGSRTCFQCEGTGQRLIARIVLDPGLDDVMDKLDDIMEKLDEILGV